MDTFELGNIDFSEYWSNFVLSYSSESKRLMNNINNHATERCLPDGQNMRLEIGNFQEKMSNSPYKSEAHEVIYMTEKLYEFLEGGLPYDRMLILRDELITQAKAKRHSQS